MDKIQEYIERRDKQVRENMTDGELANAMYRFTRQLVRTDYVRNFTWMGIPVLQYPQDMMVMQELIYKICPDFLIELGIGYGGMLAFYDAVMPIQAQKIGVDIAILAEIREMGNTYFIEQSSINVLTLYQIEKILNDWITFYSASPRVMVCLDSLHTHEHVLKELEMYTPLVSVGSYAVVFDTAIEYYGHLDKNQDRPWGRGNNPATAVVEFLKTEMGKNFEVDREIEQRALITSAPGGFLRRVK